MTKKQKISTIVKEYFKLFLISTLLFSLSPILPALAASFDPNYIISNDELIDYNSFSLNSIQKFLEGRNGTLKKYKAADIDGKVCSAAEIIYNAAQRNKINPQILITLLQKEQSLIDNPNPSQYNYDWATGYARCDSCDPTDPIVAKYKGFATQINSAAERFKWYLEQYATDSNDWLKQPGKTYDIFKTYQTPPSYKITPLNEATASLYNYTPYYNGNYSFWNLWNNWFAKAYPDGTLLQAEGEPGVWLIQFDKKRPFLSKTALYSSYDAKKIIVVDKVVLDRYEPGNPIKFANYSLFRSPGGTVYLLVNNEIRGFKSREAFKMIGYNPEEIIDLKWEELKQFAEGEPITIKSTYPTGALLQNNKTGAVFYVQNGIKSGLIDKIFLTLNFKNKKIIRVTTEELDKYETVPPVILKDGELVKSVKQSTIYVISNGEKRPIASMEAFEGLGYKRKNIIIVPDKVLTLHPTGEIVDVVSQKVTNSLYER